MGGEKMQGGGGVTVQMGDSNHNSCRGVTSAFWGHISNVICPGSFFSFYFIEIKCPASFRYIVQ